MAAIDAELAYQSVHARNVNLVCVPISRLHALALECARQLTIATHAPAARARSRKLLDVVLPVSYGDDFYVKLVDTPTEFTKMAYYRDVFVGVVGARVESLAPDGGAAAAAAADAGAGAVGVTGASLGVVAPVGGVAVAGPAGRRLYVMVLAVLAPYRSRGIGSALLRSALRAADESCAKTGITEVVLHSAEDNTEAIAFYARFGFTVTGRVENYYRRLETTPHAVILTRPVPFASKS